MLVIARSEATKQSRSRCTRPLDCFASLAMTGYERSRSRGAFFAPEASARTPRKLCLQKNKGRRSAERRILRIRTGTSDERIRTAGQCGARHEWSALPRSSACGRPRLSALRRGTFQLRAALTGICSGLRYCRPLLLASSSRPDRSIGEAGSEAARERSAYSARRRRSSLHQTARQRLTPLMSELE